MVSREFSGFVDLQVNGFRGTDFSDPNLSPDACATVFRRLIEAGTVCFLPTLITSNVDLYRRNIPIIVETMRAPEFRRHCLGIHLEGPFLSPKPGAIGAHNPDLARRADLDLYLRLEELCDGELRLLTVAADAEGAVDVISHASSRGVAVSLGHQLAMEDDLDRAASAGAVSLTHLGNGVPLTLPRHPNPIFAGLAEDRLTAMIITDGHHIPRSLIKTVLRVKGIGRTVVTSDSSPLAGLPPGEYESMGHHIVLARDGRLYDPQKGNLVGSSSTMFECMCYLASLDLLSFDELFRVGVSNPLRLIGMQEGASSVRADARVRVRYDDAGRTFVLVK